MKVGSRWTPYISCLRAMLFPRHGRASSERLGWFSPEGSSGTQHNARDDGQAAAAALVIPPRRFAHLHSGKSSLFTPTLTPDSLGDCTHAVFFQKYHFPNKSTAVCTSPWYRHTLFSFMF